MNNGKNIDQNRTIIEINFSERVNQNENYT